MRDPETFQPNVNGNRFAPLASRRRPASSGAIRAALRDGEIGGVRPPRSHHRSRGAGVIVATQLGSDTDADDELLSSVPEDLHGLLKQVPPLRRTLWGWRGVRVGEASNPGPVQTRSARRLAEPLQDTVQDSVTVDVSTSRRQRRRLRALPWSWDSDSDLDEPVHTQVSRSQRSCPITQEDALSDEEVLVRSNRGRRVVSRTDGELLATAPASSEAVFAAGFLPEVETSGTQHSPRRVFSVPEDVVDALEADMVVEDVGRPVEVFAMTDEAPEEFGGFGSSECRWDSTIPS